MRRSHALSGERRSALAATQRRVYAAACSSVTARLTASSIACVELGEAGAADAACHQHDLKQRAVAERGRGLEHDVGDREFAGRERVALLLDRAAHLQAAPGELDR